MKTPIYLQMYSVRDCCEKDYDATLKTVKELGYDGVEPAGYYGHTPEEMKAMIDKYGFEIVGNHCGMGGPTEEDTLKVIEAQKALDNKYVVTQTYGISTQDDVDKFVEAANKKIEMFKEHGIELLVHNHYQEFKVLENGETIFDQFINRTNIKFEVDTYWAYVAGQDPIALMERLGDRLVLAHIKDGTMDKKGTQLGMGEAPVKEVYEYLKKKNIPIIVESETCTPTGLAEAEICINYLKALD